VSRSGVKPRFSQLDVIVVPESETPDLSLVPPVDHSMTPASTESSIATKSSRFSAECEIWPVRVDQFAPAQLYRIWQRIEALPYFVDDSLRDPFTFSSILTSPSSRVFLLGSDRDNPSGLAYAHNIVPGVSACTGIFIWGRDAHGTIEPLRNAMRALVREFSLHKFYGHIAEPNRLSHRLAKRIGFVKEGDLREALCYRGVWTDVFVYSLLASELG
jgi:hypothetical protein